MDTGRQRYDFVPDPGPRVEQPLDHHANHGSKTKHCIDCKGTNAQLLHFTGNE